MQVRGQRPPTRSTTDRKHSDQGIEVVAISHGLILNELVRDLACIELADLLRRRSYKIEKKKEKIVMDEEEKKQKKGKNKGKKKRKEKTRRV